MPPLDRVMDQVADLITEASATAIEPRFATLADRDVREKVAGELVTVADVEAERLLTGRLQELLPGVPVIGEEGSADDPTRLELLATGRCWVVDPLDGTANFVAGSPDWAVMVALVEPTATVAAWIWQPIHRRLYRAERGAGTTRNGDRVIRRAADRDVAPVGVVMTKFHDAATRSHVEAGSAAFGSVSAGSGAAGIEYPAVIDGDQDFVAFWRTRPWDHAPGSLLVEEAGGHVRQHDGERYDVGRRRPGLIAAADPATWQLARDLLGPTPTGLTTP